MRGGEGDAETQVGGEGEGEGQMDGRREGDRSDGE
jgi:hypothetical protein